VGDADPFPEFVGAIECGLGAMVAIIGTHIPLASSECQVNVKLGLVSGFTGTKQQVKSSSVWTVDGGLDGAAIALAGGSRILSEDKDPG